jgi:carboxylesterase
MPNVYSEDVAPFRYEGSPVGCLLTHGLTGTPFEMKELGQAVHAEGFSVSGPLLAGHATNDWHDLAAVTWHDWVDSVQAEYDYLAARCDRIIMVGLSLGGCLSLWLTACGMAKPAALVVMASPAYLLSPVQRLLIRLLSPIVPYKNKGVSSICEPVARATQKTGKHTVYRAAYSADQLVGQLRPRLPQVKVPVRFIYSTKDPTVKPSNGDYMIEHAGSANKRLIWVENSFHILTRDYDKQIVFDQVLDCARQVRDNS